MSFVLVLGLVCSISSVSAKAANTLALNGKTRVTVGEDETVIYDFTMPENGTFNLLVSTSYDDRKKITIKILDVNNKELDNDNNKWETNDLNDNLNDLKMPIQLTKGSYKVSFKYKGDSVWNYDVQTRYLPVTQVAVNASWKLQLYEKEVKVYKVTVPENGYYIINTSVNCNPHDVYFYILDRNGNEVDDDDVNPDWSENKATGMYRMNWITKPLTKGQYFVKVVNNTSGIVDFPIKITYKIPVQKISVKKASVILKKGKSYAIKYSSIPASTTDAVKFTSSNKKVATVSAKGVVKGKKKGKTTINIVSSSGVKKQIKVTVK